VIERLTRQKLTEGADVTANSMKPLAAAAKQAAASARLGATEAGAPTPEEEAPEALPAAS
jgi:recombination protein RecA